MKSLINHNLENSKPMKKEFQDKVLLWTIKQKVTVSFIGFSILQPIKSEKYVWFSGANEYYKQNV